MELAGVPGHPLMEKCSLISVPCCSPGRAIIPLSGHFKEPFRDKSTLVSIFKLRAVEFGRERGFSLGRHRHRSSWGDNCTECLHFDIIFILLRMEQWSKLEGTWKTESGLLLLLNTTAMHLEFFNLC